MARAISGAHWVAHLAGGAAAGAILGAVAYAAALRASPQGHLARLRELRRRSRAEGDEVMERPSA